MKECWCFRNIIKHISNLEQCCEYYVTLLVDQNLLVISGFISSFFQRIYVNNINPIEDREITEEISATIKFIFSSTMAATVVPINMKTYKVPEVYRKAIPESNECSLRRLVDTKEPIVSNRS